MKIAVSCGDCNGIGLEVFFKAISNLSESFFIKNEFILVINSKSLEEYLKKSKSDIKLLESSVNVDKKMIDIIDSGVYSEIKLGKETLESGKQAAAAVYRSLELIDSGKADVLLTLPISKKAIQLAGVDFPGHTELIADHYSVSNPLMILTSGKTRLALATIHIPVQKVSGQLDEELIINRIQALNDSMKLDFGIEKPKIAVLSLNPHSGENGKIGNEELDQINPAIKKSGSLRIDVTGPFASDGFFGFGEYKKFDGILAMYHDQGLIPLKLLANGNGVNFTAGLPIIRTSPDHGTAFGIAGKNLADPKSTLEAIKLAINIFRNRRLRSKK